MIGDTTIGAGADSGPGRGVVLVLDDDPVIGELLSVVLGRAGFEPRTPVDWRAAVDGASERGERIVAAVCDLQLGHANGADLLGELCERLPGVCAVLISGHSTAHIHTELARAGIDAIVFQKPFRASEMVAAITAAISVAD